MKKFQLKTNKPTVAEIKEVSKLMKKFGFNRPLIKKLKPSTEINLNMDGEDTKPVYKICTTKEITDKINEIIDHLNYHSKWGL